MCVPHELFPLEGNFGKGLVLTTVFKTCKSVIALDYIFTTYTCQKKNL